MRWSLSLLMVVIAAVSAGCGPPAVAEGPKPNPPATVKVHPDEASLATITLTPETETRIKIETAPVASRRMQRCETVGGEVIVPPGRAITVSAPQAGTLLAPKTGAALVPGKLLAKDQPLFSLAPLLSADARTQLAASLAQAEGAVKKANVAVEAAKITLARCEQLLRDGAGSRRSLDDARAEHGLAQASLKAAETHRDLLRDQGRNAAGEQLQITSPINGVLQKLHVTAGQVVAPGSPLFEVVILDRLWVRVPVYVGELPELDLTTEVLIGDIGAIPGRASRTARPVVAPPSADADAASVDLFYEVDNKDRRLQPGQKVGVTLTLKTPAESLVVPWPAVLHDVHGGTWVYEKTGPHAYRRTRVQVQYVVDSVAVLKEGPPAGTLVVTERAMELFGTEFGIGK